MSERYANYIGGEWTPPANGEFLPDINPADKEDIIGEFPSSDADDARRAVEAAVEAQAAWAALPAPARGEFLRRAADVLEARADRVAFDLMREEGKSVPEARGETLRGVTILRYYAGQTMLPEGEVIPSASAKTLLLTRRVPLGVCTLITPWNFPIAIPVWKAAPALAFGNTVVLKPAGYAPLTARHVARCFEEAGLPLGVLNLLYGRGARVGEMLATHRSVAALSFTGSAQTGKTLAAWAAAHGKKYQLEMGGKNAVVVLPDTDMEQAVNLTVQGAFKSAGQKCTATARAIVHADVYDEFSERLVEKTRALKVGPGDDPEAYLGPVITPEARDWMLERIEEAKADGALLLCGGEKPSGEVYERGAFLEPTVFGDVRTEMRIAQEEIFGPVLCLMRADDLDHALAILNDVEYGLSASLFTRDLNAAMSFADRAQAGMLRINGETAGVEPQAPFGGMKASSSYSREQGMAARDFFTQIKTISVDRVGG
jgi:acyl-CoA reductase-like NAD-dependent aldehyde dehydrogenase